MSASSAPTARRGDAVLLRALAALIVAVAPLAAGDAPPPLPPPGTAFHFHALHYIAGEIRVRDVAEELSPCLFYEDKRDNGRNVRGLFTFDPAAPRGAFTLTCPRLAQRSGAELRILGERMAAEPELGAVFELTSCGPWLPAAPADVPRGEADASGPHTWMQTDGVLTLGATRVPVRGPARLRYNLRAESRGISANMLLGMSVQLRCFYRARGSDLGLKQHAAKDVAITVITRAFTEATLLAGTKAKSLAELGITP